jgi:HSP20 family protein
MHDLHRILLSSEVREFHDEVARLFENLESGAGAARVSVTGHCTPVLDVQETSAGIEVVVDLPGVSSEFARVLIKRDVLMVAGLKPSPYSADRCGASFHVVERGFGRFVRAVQLEGAFDGGRARAVLQSGELRVTIPRIADRRGQEILVPVTTA